MSYRRFITFTRDGTKTRKVRKGRQARGAALGRVCRAKKPRRGTGCHQAKLTDERVVEIRRLWSERVSMRRIAVMFSVCVQTVHDVIKRSTWKHVA